MRNSLAAFFAALLFVFIAVPVAEAAPTDVSVRIEGKSETLFEKTIAVSPRAVMASSDTTERRCDGINVNVPQNVTPGVTPTAASATALESIGETFDGQWYEGFEDYFLTRWGPDSQDPGAGAYWGILVNEIFTSVGGCQYQLDSGDEVLWVYDAFQGRPSLALFPVAANYQSGPRPLTAIVQPGQPLAVEVVSYGTSSEGSPPGGPTRAGSAPYAGAAVAPVLTGAKGFQRVETASPAAVTTDAGGRASVAFAEPGWHRIKATVGSPGAETVIRSNRLDVCVRAAFGDCGERADPPRTEPAPPAVAAAAAATPPQPIRLGAVRLDRSKLAQGRLEIGWTLLDSGAGLKSWRIQAKALGRKGARWISKATGAQGSTTTIRLSPGAGVRLRLVLTDGLGRQSYTAIGKVTVPRAGRG